MRSKRSGAVNYKGVESEQSKARRKKDKKRTAEDMVEDIRNTPGRRMPTKGSEYYSKKAK